MIQEEASPIGLTIGKGGPVITHRMHTPFGWFIHNRSKDHNEVVGFIRGSSIVLKFKWDSRSLTPDDDIIKELGNEISNSKSI